MIAPRPKPRYGEACNGCGLCCMAGPCHVAEEHGLFDHDRRSCEALATCPETGVMVCIMMVEPEALFPPELDPFGVAWSAERVRYELGEGAGCGMEDED